jgi:hypothetical protein
MGGQVFNGGWGWTVLDFIFWIVVYSFQYESNDKCRVMKLMIIMSV